jgi:hypothetical protein
MASKDQVMVGQRFANKVGVPLGVDGKNGFLSKRFFRMFQDSFQFGDYGMFPLVVDGDPGLKTLAAMRLSERNGCAASKHFVYAEFRTKGSLVVSRQNEVLLVVRDQVAALEALRVTIGQPLHLLSPFRDPTHNTLVGGAKNSQHLYGRAADIDRPRTARPVSEAEARAAGFRGVGMISRSNPDVVHVDVRGFDARWFYS